MTGTGFIAIATLLGLMIFAIWADSRVRAELARQERNERLKWMAISRGGRSYVHENIFGRFSHKVF